MFLAVCKATLEGRPVCLAQFSPQSSSGPARSMEQGCLDVVFAVLQSALILMHYIYFFKKNGPHVAQEMRALQQVVAPVSHPRRGDNPGSTVYGDIYIYGFGMLSDVYGRLW